jgi:hypothetical protein
MSPELEKTILNAYVSVAIVAVVVSLILLVVYGGS